MTDAVLFNKWRSERDAEAFRELASRYSGMVYATCLRVLRNPQEAEEAAQECFEKLAGAPRIASPYLGPWLHKVATNNALGRLRSEGRRRIREDRYAREHGIQHMPEWEDIYPLVDEAIAGLPEELRVPLVRHFLENRTHEAIALELGLSRTAITYRLQKALERVRRNLKRRGVEVASTAFATLLAEKMAEAAVVPASLEAALGSLAVAGLKVAPVTAGGASALLGGLAVKVLLGAAAAVVTLGFTWNMFIPEQPATVPVQHAPTPQLASAESLSPAPKAVVPAPAPTPVAVEAAPVAASEGGGVTGRVYDAKTGRGIAGVKVWAGASGCEPSGKATSDADGAYRITGLAAGRTTVGTSGNIAGYVERFDRSVETTIEPQKSVEGIDFALDRGIPVSGRVLSAEGKAVSGARVGAITDDKTTTVQWDNTDENGAFTVDMPTPGTNLQIQAKYNDIQSAAVVHERLELEGLKGIEVVLTEPRTSSIEGRLLLPDRRPAAGYSVRVTSGNTQYLIGLPEGVVGADGSFKLEKLASGTYNALFQRPGKWGHSGDNELGPLTVATGQALKDVELRIRAAAEGLRISGRVVDKSGAGVAQATVQASIVLPHGYGEGPATVADDHGAFTLFGLKEDTFRVRVLPPDNRHSITSVEDVAAGTQGLNIVVLEIGRIEGHVLNARDGKPVQNFETYLWAGDNATYPYHLLNRRDINDPTGAFTREAVDVGPQTITVKAPGYAQAVQVIQVTEGPAATKAEFLLEPAGPLNGKVIDESGNPVANANIFAGRNFPRRPNEETLARTGEDGTFSLEPLSPAISYIVVHHPDYPPAKANLDRLESIVLEKGGEAEGRVTVNGQPVEGCRISGILGQDEYNTVLTKADGSYRLGPLQTGTTYLKSNLAGREPTGKEVIIARGALTEVNFDFPSEDATVEGTVTISGEPVSNAVILLISETDAGQSSKMQKTDTAGHYRFGNAPPGPGRLAFTGIFGEPPSTMWDYRLDIQPGDTLVQDFTLDATGVITGKVPGVTDEMLARVFLQSAPPATAPGPGAVPSSGRPLLPSVIVICGADGSFEIPNVPPGDYVLRVMVNSKADPESILYEKKDPGPIHVENGPVTVNLTPE